ncbi:MAG: C45 family peptidase [Polyangiaceae bacterium]
MKHPRWRRPSIAFAVILALGGAVWLGLRQAARMEPTAVNVTRSEVRAEGASRHLGSSRAYKTGEITTVELGGTPEQIGYDHARLLRDELFTVEGDIFQDFEQRLPSGAARRLLMDIAGFRYRGLSSSYDDARRRELSGQALGLAPDPFSKVFPSFQRLVYLNALYDIALSFEHSPIVGCTTFVVDARSRGGGVLLARNFDFDVGKSFDEHKVVFLVREAGKVPFASVAWPGLVGVVSGVNAEGVAAVVHGARAGPTSTRGEPVVHALRRVLSHATTAEHAVELLAEGQAMVSHIVIVADRSGKAFVVERTVNAPPFARPLQGDACVTNHLEGPARSDPKNQRVLETTTTRERRERGDALLHTPTQTVADAVAMLRDRKGAAGNDLPLGDRRAIDAFIAGHGVVVDFTDEALWVSEGPRLAGRFVAFDLRSGLGSASPRPFRSLPEDPERHAPEIEKLLAP